MPNRINRVIELFEAGQPVYYVGGHTGNELTYDAGKRMSKTWADYINIGMEHGAFDMAGLDQFMKGLVDGGPTNSGHRTPPVIVEAPVDGGSVESIRYNAWQFRQILARGVHGILLCQAENPAAVKAFVEACRYPFHTLGVGAGLDHGERGNGGQASAAPIWGISNEEYLDKAEPWPLNPDGEMILGLKIENKRALNTVESTLRVPGIAFAEWGPGDMALSHGYKSSQPKPRPAELEAARTRIRDACFANGVKFLDGGGPEDVAERIDEGVMIAGSLEATAAAGRAHTNRSEVMPV
ncbi:MAG: aldolase/citrate lyase family protein [Chloroflexi bacterium]|nr:aldolase/citrate lyase family protein [Chloroflexota bacterium]